MADPQSPKEPQSPQQPAIDETPILPCRNAGRRDSLADMLKHRPERAELVGRGILPDSTAAPGVIQHQQELKKHMRADSLNNKISHRPTPEKLVETGVLHEDPRTVEEESSTTIITTLG